MAIRKLLHRAVCVVAGFVYQRGVDLYRLSDWLDTSDDETATTEPELVAMWNVSEPTTTTGVENVTWTRSS